jgi:hypothetical protein
MGEPCDTKSTGRGSVGVVGWAVEVVIQAIWRRQPALQYTINLIAACAIFYLANSLKDATL